MSWSYSGDPASSELDFVRYKIGDTDTNDQQITNEEIEYEIAQADTPLKAAYQCARTILKSLSRRADKKIGPASIKNSQLMGMYKEIIQDIKTELEDAAQALPSMEEPHEAIFDIGLMDNKGVDY